ncbi:Radical SAM superfamily protein [Caprobacter fermentans]|uniref:Radical SAM superfamily protein n=1 Tax=Caproicibacter fermentans TaxID=2576756 RepID=A0A6N8HVG7_9FIRM|nr:AmmeMemoRadiSam system radical SAM enzyme [Caproicibacter fermentans]MVB09791.1 Radical SAM superfamily protein [Caproicibacter fermentans]OCN03192.1 AmmeMemoRadiSam system radical SAM enzyme [Clostridium sp. W14A]
MSRIVCDVCPHLCALEEEQTGFCGARSNQGGKISADSYGRVTAVALDPVEKKPLRRFFPGSRILSVGSYGCNLRCPGCQNHAISMVRPGEDSGTEYLSPKVLSDQALELKAAGNIGIAFTYNEPLICPEYVLDCSRLNRENGLKNVAVTNGYVNPRTLRRLLPMLDAMNIDLKSFSPEFYRRISGGLDEVKQAISIASEVCHVEVTTLIIPGENDTAEEMDRLSGWLSEVNPEIPLHVTRFFPRYKQADKSPTPVGTVGSLAEAARRNLKYVYEGNV